MEKTWFFFVAVLTAPIFVMWIKIFIFYEVAIVLPLLAYLFILILMADQILQDKATTMNKGNQTKTRPMKDQSVQTDYHCAIQSEEVPEMELGVSGFQTVEERELEIHRLCRKYMRMSETSTEAEESSEVTRKESSFFVPTDPTDDNTEASENGPVAEWYLDYIRKKHAKKQQVPFFRRKVKISKLFSKKKNKAS